MANQSSYMCAVEFGMIDYIAYKIALVITYQSSNLVKPF